MRRDIADKSYLKAFIVAFVIVIYESLSDMYYALPPLLGVAFVLADEAYRNNNRYLLASLVLFLLLFEATKGFLFFSTVIFFYLSFVLILPMIRQFLICKKCLNPLFVTYAYLGYYLFIQFLGALFNFIPPDFSPIIIYYILIEILFLVILL